MDKRNISDRNRRARGTRRTSRARRPSRSRYNSSELKVTIPEDRTISIGETLTFKVEVSDDSGEALLGVESPGGPVLIDEETCTYTAEQAGIHTIIVRAIDEAE